MGLPPLGIDIACRAAHQASLADVRGEFLWSDTRSAPTARDLDRAVVEPLPPGHRSIHGDRRHGADAQCLGGARRMVPSPGGRRRAPGLPERAADLRAYYAKHTKSDRLDSRPPRPPAAAPSHGPPPGARPGPGDPLRRATKLHSTLVLRRATVLARLDALLEILGPAWHAAIGADFANRTPLKFLAAGYADPYVVKRLGRTRLARFCYRHSRGAWGEDRGRRLARSRPPDSGVVGRRAGFPDLAEDIAIEARLALQLTEELKDLDERTALLLHRDPTAS